MQLLYFPGISTYLCEQEHLFFHTLRLNSPLHTGGPHQSVVRLEFSAVKETAADCRRELEEKLSPEFGLVYA